MNDPRLETITVVPTDQRITNLLKDHKEAFVVLVDPQNDGESNLVTYVKLSNNDGILASYLETVIENLIRVRNDKKPDSPGKATASA